MLNRSDVTTKLKYPLLSHSIAFARRSATLPQAIRPAMLSIILYPLSHTYSLVVPLRLTFPTALCRLRPHFAPHSLLLPFLFHPPHAQIHPLRPNNHAYTQIPFLNPLLPRNFAYYRILLAAPPQPYAPSDRLSISLQIKHQTQPLIPNFRFVHCSHLFRTTPRLTSPKRPLLAHYLHPPLVFSLTTLYQAPCFAPPRTYVLMHIIAHEQMFVKPAFGTAFAGFR